MTYNVFGGMLNLAQLPLLLLHSRVVLHVQNHFVFREIGAHFSALYYVNALHAFLGYSFPLCFEIES